MSGRVDVTGLNLDAGLLLFFGTLTFADRRSKVVVFSVFSSLLPSQSLWKSGILRPYSYSFGHHGRHLMFSEANKFEFHKEAVYNHNQGKFQTQKQMHICVCPGLFAKTRDTSVTLIGHSGHYYVFRHSGLQF